MKKHNLEAPVSGNNNGGLLFNNACVNEDETYFILFVIKVKYVPPT